jgi:tripartite-type tricarboxylate transporter receptor subunit TctC
MIRYLLAVVAGLQFAMPGVALAQDYPSKPIRMLVGYAPGGGTDIIARLMAHHLRAALGQPVVVENRPGAGESIADALVAHAAADGYTLLMAASAVTINPFLYKEMSFDVSRDLTGVAIIANSPVVLVTHPSLAIQNVAELISYAKANPGKLAYATPGIGTVQHLAAELFKSMTRTDLTHVPYKGGAPAMTDLAAGQVQLSFAAITSAQPFIKSGRLRALATGDERRSDQPGALPTIGETVPGYEVAIWYGILAPAATPKVIVDRLNRELAAIVQLKEVKIQMTEQGYESAVTPVERMNQRIRADLEKWGRAAKQAGIKPE